MKKIFFILSAFSFLMVECKKKKIDPIPIPVTDTSGQITSFILKQSSNPNFLKSDIVGVINKDTITLSFDYGTLINSLSPEIIFTGKSVLPGNALIQDFSQSIAYTVTLNNDKKHTYIVKSVFLPKKTVNTFIYFGCEDGYIYSLNANDGSLNWKYYAGHGFQSSPTIVNDILFIGDEAGYLYAINSLSGTLKWKTWLNVNGIASSPCISNGVVFIGVGGLYALSTNYVFFKILAVDINTGGIKWEYFKNSPAANIPSPVVYNGKVFLTTATNVFAFDENNGTILWNKNVGLISNNPAIYNGKLYAVDEGKLWCLDPENGNTIFQNNANVTGNVTIDNGIIYTGSSTGCIKTFDVNSGNYLGQLPPTTDPNYKGFYNPFVYNKIGYVAYGESILFAFNTQDSSLRWSFNTNTYSNYIYNYSNPTAANNVVYFGAVTKYMYALDAYTGQLLWKFQTNGSIYSGPCILDNNGIVYNSTASGMKN